MYKQKKDIVKALKRLTYKQMKNMNSKQSHTVTRLRANKLKIMTQLCRDKRADKLKINCLACQQRKMCERLHKTKSPAKVTRQRKEK